MLNKKIRKVVFLALIVVAALLIIYFIFAVFKFCPIKQVSNSNEYEWVQSDIIHEENKLSPEIKAGDNLTVPINNAPEKGYFIYINLDELKMYIFKDKALIKNYPVSGGKPSTPSPEGIWVITTKDTWGEGFGGRWMGFYVPWGMYGIHGTITPWEIGKYNASEGCIRMKNSELKELYSIIPHGTKVFIEQKNKPFRVLRNGDIGSDVLKLQKNLKELKYFNGYPDGIFGAIVEKSVKQFQEDNKLYASGIVNKNMWELIIKKINELHQAEPQQ